MRRLLLSRNTVVVTRFEISENFHLLKFFFWTAKRHAHDMVHVEVWLGDGDKTIGARWRTGV